MALPVFFHEAGSRWWCLKIHETSTCKIFWREHIPKTWTNFGRSFYLSLAHAWTCIISCRSIPSPNCWLFSRNQGICPAGNKDVIAITNLSGLHNKYPYRFPSPGGCPTGQSQTRHPWRRKKYVLWSFLLHHPKRRRYLWMAPGRVGFPSRSDCQRVPAWLKNHSTYGKLQSGASGFNRDRLVCK